MSATVIPFPISRARLPMGVRSIEAFLYDKYIEASLTRRANPTEANVAKENAAWIAWKQASDIL